MFNGVRASWEKMGKFWRRRSDRCTAMGCNSCHRTVHFNVVKMVILHCAHFTTIKQKPHKEQEVGGSVKECVRMWMPGGRSGLRAPGSESAGGAGRVRRGRRPAHRGSREGRRAGVGCGHSTMDSSHRAVREAHGGLSKTLCEAEDKEPHPGSTQFGTGPSCSACPEWLLPGGLQEEGTTCLAAGWKAAPQLCGEGAHYWRKGMRGEAQKERGREMGGGRGTN